MTRLRSVAGRVRRRFGPSRLELVSLHVPKTAGVSFRAALADVYGDDLALVYDGAAPDGTRVRVVHGHFSPPQFARAGRHAKWIMWLRDPVDRIVSYYDFWLQAEPHGNPNHDYFLSQNMSLLTFASWEPIRTEFAETYVRGLDPGDLFFVGITERYQADLHRLGELLGWPTSPRVDHANVNRSPRSSVDEATRSRIQELHSTEMDWYRHFS